MCSCQRFIPHNKTKNRRDSQFDKTSFFIFYKPVIGICFLIRDQLLVV